LTAILIDHDNIALDQLEKILVQDGRIEVIGKYTNPFQGLLEINSKRPAVVFLEVEFTGISGIEMAKKIRQTNSNTKFVFVTCNDRYAVDAFELKAIDYIIKPIHKKRLSETISCLVKESNIKTDSLPMVCCFHTLHFIKNGRINEEIKVKWRTKKSKELFAYMLQYRNVSIRKDTLLEVFWGNEDIEHAYSQLYTSIYHIRKMLQSIDFNITISSLGDTYKLELNDVLLDVNEWENGLESFPVITKDNVMSNHELLNLYKGDYLEDEGYHWTENEKARLRINWVKKLKSVAGFYISSGNYTEAIILYLKMQKTLPYKPDSYFLLMQLYDKFRDPYSVKEQYTRLRKMLLEEYNEEPNQEIQDWYNAWQKRHKEKYNTFIMQ